MGAHSSNATEEPQGLDIDAIKRLLGGGGPESEPEAIDVAPSRVVQAIEQHRGLFGGFTVDEIEKSEHCLMAASLALFHKSFSEVVTKSNTEHVTQIMDLAVVIAKSLPKPAVEASAAKGDTNKGYL